MENYASMESDVALLLPGRTPKTCIARANYLNLHVKQRWTPEEDNILRENYPQMGTNSVSLLPGRTRSACERRAGQLGIYTDACRPWTPNEDAILREHYPVLGSNVVPLIPDRKGSACSMRAAKLGIRYLRKGEREKYIAQTGWVSPLNSQN